MSESPSVCLTDARRGTDLSAVQYTTGKLSKRQTIIFLMKMYASYTYQETFRDLQIKCSLCAFLLRRPTYSQAPGDLNF